MDRLLLVQNPPYKREFKQLHEILPTYLKF